MEAAGTVVVVVVVCRFLLCTAASRFVLVVTLNTETHVLHNLTASRWFISLLWQMFGRRSRLARLQLTNKLQLATKQAGSAPEKSAGADNLAKSDCGAGLYRLQLIAVDEL